MIIRSINIHELQGIATFSPPHHTKTTDRKLMDEACGARHFALWHGEVEPGGMAEAHIHEEMEQVFIVLGGEGLFKVGSEKQKLGKDTIIFVPSGQTHEIHSVGDSPLRLLIFMAPPPATFDVWQKKKP